MKRRPPISTRTDTLFPYTTLFRAAFDPVRILEADPAARVDRRTSAGGERHMGAVRARLADRAVEHLPHQPLRAVRAEAGVSEPAGRSTRSEEHTSELQSLMRNSYAVFCLKKKNTDLRTTIRK